MADDLLIRDDSPMLSGATRTVARARTRRRVRALLGIVVVCGVAGALVLTSLAGARRAATAVDRALDAAAVADVSVDVTFADGATLDEVRAIDEVEQLSTIQFVAVRPAGTDLVAGIDVVGVLPVDDAATVEMDRQKLHRGRLPSPHRPEEIALSPALARRLGVGVGDRMRVEAYAAEQLGAIFSEGDVEPAGAQLEAVVVGLAEPMESVSSGADASLGIVLLSHAVHRHHGVTDLNELAGSDLGVFRMALRARLANGAADAPAYLSHVFDIYGDQANTTFSEARPEVFDGIIDTTRVEATALGLLGLIATVATLLAVGPVLSREAAVDLPGVGRSLRAAGMQRREVVGALAAPVVAAVAIGLALAIVAAYFGSRWSPAGAGAMEPDPGATLDIATVLPAAAVLFLLLGSRPVFAVWRTTRPGADARAGLAGAPLVGRFPIASLGIGMATRARSAVGTATLSVIGLVAAVTFSSSLAQLAENPRLYGHDWDLQLLFQSGGTELTAREAPVLLADDRIENLSRFQRLELGIGDRRLAGFALTPLKGVAAPSLVRGRLPVADDEIAVAPRMLDGMAVDIGDELDVSGGTEHAAMTLVGELAGPEKPDFVVSEAAAAALGAPGSDAGFLLRARDSANLPDLTRDLQGRLVQVFPPEAPAAVRNVVSVDAFPRAVAAVVAVLGLAAISHLLFTTTRRRGHELAIVRALGLTPRQVRGVIAWQATAVGLTTLLIGVPLGAAVGRLSWSAVADALDVLDDPVIPVGPVLLVVLAAVVVVNVLALLPARRAAGAPPAAGLRAE